MLPLVPLDRVEVLVREVAFANQHRGATDRHRQRDPHVYAIQPMDAVGNWKREMRNSGYEVRSNRKRKVESEGCCIGEFVKLLTTLVY